MTSRFSRYGVAESSDGRVLDALVWALRQVLQPDVFDRTRSMSVLWRSARREGEGAVALLVGAGPCGRVPDLARDTGNHAADLTASS